MYTDWNSHLTPQRNEGINIACWVNKKNQKEKIANSFNNIKDLLLMKQFNFCKIFYFLVIIF